MTAKEALDVFGNIRFTIPNYPHLEIVNQNEAQTAIEILKELVERDTPKKVTQSTFDGITTYGCPHCDYCDYVWSIIEHRRNTYCPRCGQALDWSDGK